LTLVKAPAPKLSCPDCRTSLAAVPGTCTGCGRSFELYEGVPVLLPKELADDTEERQHALYNAVAHEYDDVFPKHIANHYVSKRTGLIKELIPLCGQVLDVGCGTGLLAAAIAAEGYDLYGADLSPEMLRKANARGIHAYAATGTALPFEDNSFDVALTVAALHHMETEERVRSVVAEMGRVVKKGGYVVLWDHNPANPYWPILMKRVPQDSGDERLVPLNELLRDVYAAGMRPHKVMRSGFMPEFMPTAVYPLWKLVEKAVETLPLVNVLAAHNVVVARKP
jgi:ubiquinone/menaquinone biosynthesis C-methylase UbiE